MNRGELDQPVTIEAAVESRSGSGADLQNWTTPAVVAQRWAKIDTTGARSLLRAQQMNPETTAVITVDGFVAVTTKHRVKHDIDLRIWDIVGIICPDGGSPENAQTLELQCKSGLRKGS